LDCEKKKFLKLSIFTVTGGTGTGTGTEFFVIVLVSVPVFSDIVTVV
jgi:hypothetical protein